MRCRLMSNICMNTNVMASTSGMLMATTSPARTPRLTKLTSSTMTMASNSAARELPDGFLDHLGLVRDAMHVDADRQIGLDARHFLLERRAQVEHVAALRHRDADADGGLAVEAKHAARADPRNRASRVAKSLSRTCRSPTRMATFSSAAHRIERAAHAHGDAFAGRFDRARGDHRVLAARASRRPGPDRCRGPPSAAARNRCRRLHPARR